MGLVLLVDDVEEDGVDGDVAVDVDGEGVAHQPSVAVPEMSTLASSTISRFATSEKKRAAWWAMLRPLSRPGSRSSWHDRAGCDPASTWADPSSSPS